VRELAELTGLPELIVPEQLAECEVSLRHNMALRLSACNSHSRTEASAKAQGNLGGPYPFVVGQEDTGSGALQLCYQRRVIRAPSIARSAPSSRLSCNRW
jgi:hypothetical protein